MQAHNKFAMDGLPILLVEDTEVVADEISKMLKEFGCVVVGPFGTVASALAAVKTEQFAAALLDINLEEEFAYQVADALLDRNIPFILMTGYVQEMLEPPFNHYPMIEKPFTRAELKQKMNIVFAQRQSA